jgi:hypothetical protein
MKYVLVLLMILPLNAFGVVIFKFKDNVAQTDSEYPVTKMSATSDGLVISFKNDSGNEKTCSFVMSLGEAFEIMNHMTSSDRKYEVTCYLSSNGYIQSSRISINP